MNTTPWKVHIYKKDDVFIPMLDDGKQKFYIGTTTGEDAPLEMIERIVNAVNSHEELVKAAKELSNCLTNEPTEYAIIELALLKLDSAISKVEGK